MLCIRPAVIFLGDLPPLTDYRSPGVWEVYRLLLDRLVRPAGKRDLSGWAPLGRPDLPRLFHRLGFVPGGYGTRDGVMAAYYAPHRGTRCPP
jgi:hypothetical protein